MTDATMKAPPAEQGVKGLTSGLQRKNTVVFDDAMTIAMTKSLSTKLGRKLNELEVRAFVHYVRSMESRDWGLIHPSKIADVTVQNFIQHRYTVKAVDEKKRSDDPLDMHEILRLQIGASDSEEYEDFASVNAEGIPISRAKAERPHSDLGTLGSLDAVSSVKSIGTVQNLEKIVGLSSKAALQDLFNPRASYKKNYIILDTRYRSNDTDGTSEFSWDLLNNSTAGGPGVVNSLGNVKNIVAIRVMPIRIPYTDVVFVSSYKRVSLFIKEFSTQAFIGQEGRRFHFIFSANVDDNSIDLDPLPRTPDSGLYEFAKPITALNSLTISFGNPLEPIVFDPDRLYVTVSYTSPATFTTATDHKLYTADQVYFTNFTTGDVVADKDVIAQVNSVNGHNIFKTSETTFVIDGIDLTAVSQIAGQRILCYFGSKRIVVPLEITYIDTTDRRTAE